VKRGKNETIIILLVCTHARMNLECLQQLRVLSVSGNGQQIEKDAIHTSKIRHDFFCKRPPHSYREPFAIIACNTRAMILRYVVAAHYINLNVNVVVDGHGDRTTQLKINAQSCSVATRGCKFGLCITHGAVGVGFKVVRLPCKNWSVRIALSPFTLKMARAICPVTGL